MRGFKKVTKTCIATVLGLSLVSTGAAPLAIAEGSKGSTIDFKPQVGGVFDGMPLFDGNPEHLDEYVDTYFEYTGLEGPAVYATGSRNHYTLQQGEHAGKKIPGALSAANDGQGVSTDFPALVGMGQTWNKELITDIGKVIGDEKIGTLKVKQGNSNIHPSASTPNPSQTVAFTVISDLRINPLNGRFDEGFTEDPYLGGVMVDNLSGGLGGTVLPESENGFWMRAAVGTRHYSVYNGQWFRLNAENSASARSIYDYHTKSVLKGFESGSLSGVMTSFGATNGIPNIISPYQIHANNHAKYGVYSSPDFNGDQRVFQEDSFGNGYDTKYAKDRVHASVLMALAHANAGRPSPSEAFGKEDVIGLVDAVEKGLYGITEEDLIEAARPHVNQMVRVGIFNEVDENGVPKNYPFAKYAGDVAESTKNFNTLEHQEVALKAAEESIVLLKNEDETLPLSKDEKATISGVYGDARFKTTYSTNQTPKIENSGLSPLAAIIGQIGKDNITYSTGNPVIGLTSQSNGNTVTVPGSRDGGQLTTTSNAFDKKNAAHLFEVYDWGQEGYSLLSLQNKRFVTSPNAGSRAFENTEVPRLNIAGNDWDGADMEGSGDTSAIPPRLRIENNEDGSVSLVSNGYLTGFGGSFVDWYYKNGRYASTTNDGKIVASNATVGNAEKAANRGDEVKFNKTIVKEVGEDAVSRASQSDYAIVFTGAIPRHSAGEGNDRSSLAMGDQDYELVEKVSEAFAKEGKKTIVVVTSSFPVDMDRIQNNENVSAIVQQNYAGQYDAYALANVLYGDSNPTGRLAATWYADMSAFPELNKYSIPEGQRTVKPEHLDPRFTVDMTNADPIESKLTYMYTEAPVTYEFGYGLSYSRFEFSNFTVPTKASSEKPFEVTVNVRNTGSRKTSEVVQLYSKNNDTAYGEHGPKKQLVGFEKVEIAPGETKTVKLTVKPEDLQIWDVNAGGFIVESGRYSFMVGASSENLKDEKTVKIDGKSLTKLNDNTFNVFDHSFASDEVIYNEVSKARTAAHLKEDKVAGEYYAVRSKQEGSWTAIPKVNLSPAKKVTAKVASNVTSGQISLHVGSPDGEKIAVIDVPKTDSTSYIIPNTEVKTEEVKYVEVTADLTKHVAGTHDLYIVFNGADLRIDSLSFENAGKGKGNSEKGEEHPGKGKGQKNKD
ncbi:exo-1,4-beta-glucosidase [Planomicrobium soli]|uniref:Exo-1,4-beta-glucosidase n=1 Tax=Planomicrobium soli TaxID=1176648 RepID=A0A2P8GQM3_9BACL|nr:glycoside hydrolase family 3 C-terminal domain-containing protein [Planomicrobium soli]PSL36271.1 exo-1,4-beta-glucosidase [Planomicrobium soli]